MAASIHPLSHPTGLSPSYGTARLNNPEFYRSFSGSGLLGDEVGHAGPLTGLNDAIGEVVHSARSTRGSSGSASGSDAAEAMSDADPPVSGIHAADDGGLYHVQTAADGSASATHIGFAGEPPASVV